MRKYISYLAVSVLILPILLASPSDIYAQAAECIDLDNDGWGWDGDNSCLVETYTPVAGECVDDDDDGWGWNGVESCLVETYTPVAGECVDDDNDGWGWNGIDSCLVENFNPTAGECIDRDLDGWGWNGVESCITEVPDQIVEIPFAITERIVENIPASILVATSVFNVSNFEPVANASEYLIIVNDIDSNLISDNNNDGNPDVETIQLYTNKANPTEDITTPMWEVLDTEKTVGINSDGTIVVTFRIAPGIDLNGEYFIGIAAELMEPDPISELVGTWDTSDGGITARMEILPNGEVFRYVNLYSYGSQFGYTEDELAYFNTLTESELYALGFTYRQIIYVRNPNDCFIYSSSGTYSLEHSDGALFLYTWREGTFSLTESVGITKLDNAIRWWLDVYPEVTDNLNLCPGLE